MANYTSDFSGQHNDEYDARIRELEGKLLELTDLLNTTINKQTQALEILDEVETISKGNIFRGFTAAGATSITYSASTQEYTIVSPKGSGTWGSGVNPTGSTTTGAIEVPYGAPYRIYMEIYCSSQHYVTIDVNNYSIDGNSWNGNDNDSNRWQPNKVVTVNGISGITFNIPANQWTPIAWGAANKSTGNFNCMPIYVKDQIGLYTANDSGNITWKIRKPIVTLDDNLTRYGITI